MATAPAIANPRVADLPRPLAAVIATVERIVFSAIDSMNLTTAFAYITSAKNYHNETNLCFNNYSSDKDIL